MLWEFLVKTSPWIKAAANFVKVKIISLIHKHKPIVLIKSTIQKYSIASEALCSMNKGHWCIKKNSHAPVFSLFTFFSKPR
jgi:hypothetical protein